MQLKTVNIKNFRSIKALDIDFTDDRFKILVGKNESGKTNILKALSFLSASHIPTNEDLREPLPDEESVEDAFVRFIFSLDAQETDRLYKAILQKVSIKNKDNKIITDGIREYSLLEFCNEINDGLYKVFISAKLKAPTTWLKPNYKFLLKIRKSKSFQKPLPGELKTFDNSLFFDMEEYPNVKIENSTAPIIKEFLDAIDEEIKAIVKENLPELVFWKYDEANLLPATINISDFENDPDTCLPLKNLFKIAGITDIGKEIKIAQAGSKNKLRNLLERVAEHATKHFRSVWKEYDYISFSLTPNGSEIDAGIKEKNTFSLDQRSDGFKRFVTFLLMLSVNDKNKDLSNTVILIDEPDMGLHPTGVRSLRDELINISTNNYILASTHSIFLIDRERISRHYIVKKIDEITQIEVTKEDNIVEEEVLYNALGYSIYDQLKEKNILFEGWRDKKLFKVAFNSLLKANKTKENLEKIGVSSSTGVKSIKNITPIFELTGKKCLVVSDNDKPAIEKQKEFKAERVYGTWKRYNEILNNAFIKTGEDFISTELLNKSLNKIKKDYPQLDNLPNTDFPKNGIILEIEEWLKVKGIVDKQETGKLINQFKDNIFNTLKASDIKKEYFEFLENLCDAIDKL